MAVGISAWRDRWLINRAQKQVRAGNRARARSDWRAAAYHYGKALEMNQGLAAIHVQHGHMLKEAGAHEAALMAYHRAIALQPESGDTWLQLGHALKLLGRLPEAVDAYHRAMILDDGSVATVNELVSAGAADLVPSLKGAHLDRIETQLSQLIEQTGALRRDFQPYVESSRSYIAFRQLYPIARPPEHASVEPSSFTILIDGRGRRAAEIAATLSSLRDQKDATWTAHVVVDEDLSEHPVAGASYTDDRIHFDPGIPVDISRDVLVVLGAGTTLDPMALSWITFVRHRTGFAACYADHDRADEVWRGPRVGRDPVLQPDFDLDWFGCALSEPAIICVGPGLIAKHDILVRSRSAHLCELALAGEKIMHIPRILSTVVDVTAEIRSAPPSSEDRLPTGNMSQKFSRAASASPAATIAVLIPTRDEAEMLARCIETIVEKASNPARIEIVVADNRSREPQTSKILAELEARFGIRSILFDEPFNWSRVNNVATIACSADLLLFLNNDTEMQTSGWDDVLAAELARSEIGLVGTRLLYPDLTLQHGGIIFGMDDGAPRHEGVGSPPTEAGPEGRWLRRRSVSAVTGAAMAMRRVVWQQVGGFDENLAVGYNDVEMCLRIRAHGYRVLYVPDIWLIHHESKTRGMNVNRSQVAWDRAELRSLYQKWGDALFSDPAMNVQWSRKGRAFVGFEEPTMATILADIDRQNQPSLMVPRLNAEF